MDSGGLWSGWAGYVDVGHKGVRVSVGAKKMVVDTPLGLPLYVCSLSPLDMVGQTHHRWVVLAIVGLYPSLLVVALSVS